MSLEEDILRRISPDPDLRRKVDATVKGLIAEVDRKAAEKHIQIQVQLVGSVAKDTYLRSPDIDIFMLFSPDTSRKELEQAGLDMGRSILNQQEARYAEHPYIHGTWNGMEVDLVPCYKIDSTEHLISAVDRTPFHTRYIRERLGEDQKNDVRLLKQFMKGIGTYGAEARTRGFSGYLLELLVLRYGTFKDVISAMAGWTNGTVLSLERAGAKKFNDPLVFFDPVDPSRNVASALSIGSFAIAIYAAQTYLADPAEKFFFPVKKGQISAEAFRRAMMERGTAMIVLRMARPKLTDDDLYPQVRKTLDGIAALLSSEGFEVLDKAFHVSCDLAFVIELSSNKLSASMKHAGPPVWIANSSMFLERWRSEGIGPPFIEDGHWAVVMKRPYVSAAFLIEDKFKDAAVGRALRKPEQMSVHDDLHMIEECDLDVISELLDKRLPWEL